MKTYTNRTNNCERCGREVYGNHRLCDDCQEEYENMMKALKRNRSEYLKDKREEHSKNNYKSRGKDSGRKRR